MNTVHIFDISTPGRCYGTIRNFGTLVAVFWGMKTPWFAFILVVIFCCFEQAFATIFVPASLKAEADEVLMEAEQNGISKINGKSIEEIRPERFGCTTDFRN